MTTLARYERPFAQKFLASKSSQAMTRRTGAAELRDIIRGQQGEERITSFLPSDKKTWDYFRSTIFNTTPISRRWYFSSFPFLKTLSK
jgi:hypothetical protein